MNQEPTTPDPDAGNDPDALVAASLAADAAGDEARATALLRRSIELRHFNPHAHYLLGTTCAQAGRSGDAVLHIATAVEQAPHLAEARLQLGLLWLTLDNPATAATALRPLLDLPASEALHHFGAALVGVAENRIADACTELREGLAIGCTNAPLMGDMRTLLERLQAAAPDDEDLRAVQHGMAISAYSGVDPTGR